MFAGLFLCIEFFCGIGDYWDFLRKFAGVKIERKIDEH